MFQKKKKRVSIENTQEYRSVFTDQDTGEVTEIEELRSSRPATNLLTNFTLFLVAIVSFQKIKINNFNL